MNGVFWSILGTTTFICPSISLWYCGSRCLPSCHWNPYQDSIFCCVCRRSLIKTTSVPIFSPWLPIFYQLSPHVCPSPRMNRYVGRPWAAVGSWIWREPSAVRHIAARRGGLQKGIQLVVLHVDRHTFALRILGETEKPWPLGPRRSHWGPCKSMGFPYP